MCKQMTEDTIAINKFVEYIKSVKLLFEDFINRKNTAILMIESTFFKERKLEDLIDNKIGVVLEKYNKVIIILPESILFDLEKDSKNKKNKNSEEKKLLREIIKLNDEAKMKKNLFGEHLQVSKGKKVTFLFPNEREIYYLCSKLELQGEGRFISLALKFGKFNDLYISGFNPSICRRCRRSPDIQHLNPLKLNKERIEDKYFFKYGY